MVLGGLQRLTLIDYPAKVAATVFTVGCNFRCPFCHNPELVVASYGATGSISEKDFFLFLNRRIGKLDGVCITGGEPTVQPDIISFMKKIKELGFSVKLDSNGTRPDVLKKIFDQKLADYVAMDIKSSLENYSKACGSQVDLERIKLSVQLIRNSGIDYEFRTTVVSGIHAYADFEKIGQWLNGSKKYVLQEFRPGKILNQNLIRPGQNDIINLNKVEQKIKNHFLKIEIR